MKNFVISSEASSEISFKSRHENTPWKWGLFVMRAPYFNLVFKLIFFTKRRPGRTSLCSFKLKSEAGQGPFSQGKACVCVWRGWQTWRSVSCQQHAERHRSTRSVRILKSCGFVKRIISEMIVCCSIAFILMIFVCLFGCDWEVFFWRETPWSQGPCPLSSPSEFLWVSR